MRRYGIAPRTKLPRLTLPNFPIDDLGVNIKLVKECEHGVNKRESHRPLVVKNTLRILYGKRLLIKQLRRVLIVLQHIKCQKPRQPVLGLWALTRFSVLKKTMKVLCFHNILVMFLLTNSGQCDSCYTRTL